MSESGRMIYRVNTEYAQIELFHEAGDTEPYEIIELDEAVHIYQSLVRCKECKKRDTFDCGVAYYDESWDEWHYDVPSEEWFCADGEREGE